MRDYLKTFGIAAIALFVASCSGGTPPVANKPVGNSTTRKAAPSTAVRGAFPSMIHPVYPSAGGGSGGAAGPVVLKSLAALPNLLSTAKELSAPLPGPVNLNAASYGLTPNIITGSEATVDASQFTSTAGPAALSARRIRPMTITPSNGFLGNGNQYLSAATNGSYVASEDANGNLYIYTISGSLVKQESPNQIYCGTNALPICSSPGQIINGIQYAPFPGDDRIVYDTGSGRWITSALWLYAQNSVATDVLAVSQSSDPTAGWNLYQFPACGANDPISNDGSDQPHLGFNSQWIVATSACKPGYSSLAVFDKSVLYSGATLTLNTNWFEFADPIENNGNRDNPVLTYGPTINNREYLTASAISNGYVEVIYSHIEGSIDAPVFYSDTDAVVTGFAASSVAAVSTPTCTGCMSTYSNGWTHSSGVWTFRNGEAYILSTMVLGDPRYANANQVDSIAISDAGVATSLQIGGGTGYGPMGSEIGVPLVNNLGYNAALIGIAISTPSYYPGIMAAQWDVDLNSLSFLNSLDEGGFTPNNGDQTRWLDYTSVMSPIPGTSNLVVGGQIAAGSSDPDRAMYYSTITTSSTPTPAPTPTPIRTPPPCIRPPCLQIVAPATLKP